MALHGPKGWGPRGYVGCVNRKVWLKQIARQVFVGAAARILLAHVRVPQLPPVWSGGNHDGL